MSGSADDFMSTVLQNSTTTGRCNVIFGELPMDHRGGIMLQVEGGLHQVNFALPAVNFTRASLQHLPLSEALQRQAAIEC